MTIAPLFYVVEDFTASNKRNVDAEAGIVRNVKIIGFESLNGRYYLPAALRSATHLYEGAKVNFDHPDKPTDARKYEDRFGVLRNVRFVEGSGVFGDLHYNPAHSLASQFAWDAENVPENLGLSHNATLRISGKKDNQGRAVIEQIVSVKSVDVVSDPATTQSLFESLNTENEMPTKENNEPGDMAYKAMRDKIEAIENSGKTGAEKMMMMRKLMGMMKTEKKEGEAAEADFVGDQGNGVSTKKPYMGEETEGISELVDAVKGLTKVVESQQAETNAATLLQTIEGEIVAAGLDPKNATHVSELFSGQLVATESAEDRAAMIAERAALLGVKAGSKSKTEQSQRPTKPVSHGVVEGQKVDDLTGAAFVSSLT